MLLKPSDYLGTILTMWNIKFKQEYVLFFLKYLRKNPPPRNCSVVSSAISNLASNYPKCQDHFAHHGIVTLLVSKLALEIADPETGAMNEFIVTICLALVRYSCAKSSRKSGKI